MQIILGRLEIDPTAVEALRPAMQDMMRETLKEAGCHQYSLAIEDEGGEGRNAILNIAERWDANADMEAHGKSAHMAAFGRALKGIVRKSDLRIYDASNERPLG